MRNALPTAMLLIARLVSAHVAAGPPAALELASRGLSHYDINGDGVCELRSIRVVSPASGPGNKGLVLVIAEPRVLASPYGAVLKHSLDTYAADLAHEGWRTGIVAMQVYDGPVHQDGRTLLAMREYLRRVRSLAPDLAGVVLVGSFPEAMLVRQYNWRQHRKTVLFKGGPREDNFGDEKVYRIRSVPEFVAGRGDIVLADLDGRWTSVYRVGPERLPWAMAVYPKAQPPTEGRPPAEWLSGGPTPYVETGTREFVDFFFINDGQFTLQPAPAGMADFRPLDELQDAECGDADGGRANPMARPDIYVSRINALHVGLEPKAGLRGAQGEALLGTDGLPQTVQFDSAKATPRGLSVWERDPDTEMRLLLEYFERNHRYRAGEFAQHARPAAAAFGLGSPMETLLRARPEWEELPAGDYDIHDGAADLTEVVRWLKRPAVLRWISAHSDPWGSSFKKSDAAGLQEACGEQAWSWIREGDKLVPTLGDAGKLDFAILRTLWQNDALPDTANLFLHSGCDIMTPGSATRYPYNDSRYGYWQGGEALMFYANGLALVGRSKVFYDFPTDFAAKLGEGRTIGHAWAHYFTAESGEANVAKVGGGIGRKRAYFWALLGDWTLTLRLPRPE